ncbi:RNA-directed DNA polymerase [Janthinobacterium sp. FW305-129]|uniref:retron St85 family RNA-directed DNA polymerase n=1 Tax=Janthinobacterium sp. FW305-129 TaxID=2775054 RepID=UPI001E2E7DEE|nr:retron St85 family RNA-directed DNA polymerase [Janthinobacterium sp. FW305-129]MCC7595911.1 RNA-directed DNA polymerase [Janthinobacterium sp. FW305-129]
MIDNLSGLIHLSLGISTTQLDRIIQRSPFTYKIYTIKKRSGGYRTIAQPAKETKFIQNWLIENIFSTFPVHECASAYKNGASILKNAELHKKGEFLSKYDFKDFFSSIKVKDLVLFFTHQLAHRFSKLDILRMAQISCVRHTELSGLCLSIGAPSSPILSNAIMYDFDAKIYEWCNKNNISYSRYADDLTFSTNELGRSDEITSLVNAAILENKIVKLQINKKKTVHLSKKYQRRITGLIITNSNIVSIGRSRKREISTLIHKFSLNMLSDDEKYRLQGLLGFSKNIEPLFIERMNVKYGKDLINQIFKIRKSTDTA